MFVTVIVMNWELSGISMLTLIMSLSLDPKKCLSEPAGQSQFLSPAITCFPGFCLTSRQLSAAQARWEIFPPSRPAPIPPLESLTRCPGLSTSRWGRAQGGGCWVAPVAMGTGSGAHVLADFLAFLCPSFAFFLFIIFYFFPPEKCSRINF